MTIRVLIADDHAIMREGLAALLSGSPDLVVVGEAGNGFDAVDQSIKLKPSVVILDIAMPGMNGIDAAALIRARNANTQIIMLSMHSSIEHLSRAFQAGAMGYVLKDSASSEILAAICSVAVGRRYVSRSMCHLEEELRQRPGTSTPLQTLSLRERHVMQLVVEGMSSAEIARRLCLSPKSVDTYRSRVMKKLGVGSVPALVKFVVANGLTPEGTD